MTFCFEPAEAVAHLRANDEALATVIERIGPFALELTPADSLFEALLRSVIYQQLHGKAAATIHGRVLALLNQHGGPSAEACSRVTDDELRAAGLSRGKLAAVRDLAAKCQAGVVPTLREAQQLADDELIARLTEVRGVGPWTVQMLLIFYLGRPDVMPTGDFGIRLAFKNLYSRRRDPTPATILKHARRWRPYRSIASWYLWRSLD
ncbi:MAG: DNA-3-methyladenine glycosylase 2 family protein [Verrucomicrobia bacterium]|nr:DNA-3-methyladenine glycosylase 2 family protein [Verrucomicrobiota bacterium]